MSSREPCFTKVPNTVLEALITSDFSSRELRVILAVIRLTLGFHREEDEISLGTISDMLLIDKGGISRTVNGLIAKKVLTECCRPDFNKGRIISLNSEFEDWIFKSTTVVGNATPTVVKNATPTVAKKTTPTYYNKENIKKITKESRKANENFKNKKSSYDIELFKEMLNRAD